MSVMRLKLYKSLILYNYWAEVGMRANEKTEMKFQKHSWAWWRNHVKGTLKGALKKP